jgi:hypothetical protein
MIDDSPPLFHWTPPPCRLLAFPLSRRIGKIRDVALKLSGKATDKHADYYRQQVEEALRKHLAKIDVVGEDQDREIAHFWSSVRNEMSRLAYHYRDRGGEAS